MTGLRPLLMTSRLDDPPVKFTWSDEHWARLGRLRGPRRDRGRGRSTSALSVRNTGNGVAVLQGWFPHPERTTAATPFPDLDQFRRQTTRHVHRRR